MAVALGFAQVIAGTGPLYTAFLILRILAGLTTLAGAAGHGLAPGTRLHARAGAAYVCCAATGDRDRHPAVSPAAGLAGLLGLCDTRAQRRDDQRFALGLRPDGTR